MQEASGECWGYIVVEGDFEGFGVLSTWVTVLIGELLCLPLCVLMMPEALHSSGQSSEAYAYRLISIH